MSNSAWSPSDKQAEMIRKYKKDVYTDGTPINFSNRIASLYKEGKVEEAKELYRQAGMDEFFGDDATAEGTFKKERSGTVYKSGDRIWNERGEINASDNKDMFGRLIRHAESTIWNPDHKFIKTRLSDQQKSDLMNQIHSGLRMGNTQPLARIVAQLQRPVRRVLDYIGFARKSAVVHEVAQGEIVYYDVDPIVNAYSVAGDAAIPATRVESERVVARHERIGSFVNISIEEAAIRSFNQMERSKDLAIQDIQRTEDKRLLNAWWVAAHDTNTPVALPPVLTLGALEQVAYTVDRNDLHATRLYMNRQELKDIRANMISNFDPVTQREIFYTGMLGTLYDYMIYVSPVIVPPGFVFATTEPDYLSYMAIWINTTAEIANRFNFGEPVFGWLMFELLGFTVVNDAAVAVGVKPGAVIPSYFSIV